jgi:hypothetical protein
MQFQLHEGDQSRPIEVDIRELIIAGMTGRDAAAVQAHLDELAEIDVKGPSRIPIYYRVSIDQLTQGDRIQALGTGSSGEVEAVLIGSSEGMLVAVGSDHTDRDVEAYSIAVSKQMCDKPISRDVWRYADLVDVWDELELASDRVDGDQKNPYQRGTVALMRTPENLIADYFDGAKELPPGYVMYTGTFATVGDIVGAGRFEMSLTNPRTGQALRHAYDIAVLPVVE